MRQGQLYANGEWRDGGQTFTHFDPSSGEPVGTVYQASVAEVDSAVMAARAALPAWRALPIASRAELLQKVVDLLVASYGNQGEPTELKKLITLEMGKRAPEADIEVIESSDMLAFFVRHAADLLGPKPLTLNKTLWPTKRSYISFEPVGVVGVIKPWNYPLELPIWALGPALMAGNTVVFKPSEHASFVAIELTRIFHEAGLPPGVVNLVTGDGRTGSALVRHPNIDMIAFTGSVAVGREIATECGRRLRKFTLELGGNDAAIVEDDADLELTANGLVWGAFCNAGQVCVRPKRVFVATSIAKNLIDLLVAKTARLRLGIDVGPIVSEHQMLKVDRQVEDAITKGARLLAGGKRAQPSKGFYYQPTILTEVTPAMNLMTNECFGPVMPIALVRNVDEAVALANASEYGLGASIWTSDMRKAEELAQRLEAGMVWINDVNVAFPEAPWGGIKNSGPGIELSEWGLYEYVNKKHVNLEESSEQTRAWWYPYNE